MFNRNQQQDDQNWVAYAQNLEVALMKLQEQMNQLQRLMEMYRSEASRNLDELRKVAQTICDNEFTMEQLGGKNKILSFSSFELAQFIMDNWKRQRKVAIDLIVDLQNTLKQKEQERRDFERQIEQMLLHQRELQQEMQRIHAAPISREPERLSSPNQQPTYDPPVIPPSFTPQSNQFSSTPPPPTIHPELPKPTQAPTPTYAEQKQNIPTPTPTKTAAETPNKPTSSTQPPIKPTQPPPQQKSPNQPNQPNQQKPHDHSQKQNQPSQKNNQPSPQNQPVASPINPKHDSSGSRQEQKTPQNNEKKQNTHQQHVDQNSNQKSNTNNSQQQAKNPSSSNQAPIPPVHKQEVVPATKPITPTEHKPMESSVPEPNMKPEASQKMGNAYAPSPRLAQVEAIDQSPKTFVALYADIEDKLQELHWSIIHAIGSRGFSESRDIEKFLSHIEGINDTKFHHAFNLLKNLDILADDKVSTGVRWFYALHLTDIGLQLYHKKYRQQAVVCEKHLLRKDHDNWDHGYCIKDTATLLDQFGYINVVHERKANTFELTNGKTWIPDIVCYDSLSNKSVYIEVELGNHTQDDFNQKMDKARMVANELRFVCNDKSAQEKIIQQYSKWKLEKHKSGVPVKNFSVYITTTKKLSEKDWGQHYPS